MLLPSNLGEDQKKVFPEICYFLANLGEDFFHFCRFLSTKNSLQPGGLFPRRVPTSRETQEGQLPPCQLRQYL